MVCRYPVGPKTSVNLTPAPGRQDHTSSPYASAPFVSLPPIAHRPKPALPSRVMPDAAASTASRPAFVTIARAPLCVGRDGTGYKVIWVFGKTEYFFQRGLDIQVTRRVTDLPVRHGNAAAIFHMPVIPGRGAASNPESVTPFVVLDSGPPPGGASRNDRS
jgi:hypothetical protein